MKCPICGNLFKDAKCPHSYGDVEKRKEHNAQLKLIDARIDKRLRDLGLIK